MENYQPIPQAIETIYRGFRFRSRLEARWAVFFDRLGLRFNYEPEGFECGTFRYLPDFYLPEIGWYAEVKPDTFTTAEEDKVYAFVKATGHRLLMLSGPPGYFAYFGIVPVDTKDAEFFDFSLDIHTYREAFQEHRLWSQPDLDGATTEELARPLFSAEYQAAVNAARSERFGT